MWIGSVPWPYSTAGTLCARRIRRAAPLPNSVRSSAVSFTSGTNELLGNFVCNFDQDSARGTQLVRPSRSRSCDPRRGNRSTLADKAPCKPIEDEISDAGHGRTRTHTALGLTVEKAGHRTIFKDLPDRPCDQGCDRQDGKRVEATFLGDRQGISDDHLFELRRF